VTPHALKKLSNINCKKIIKFYPLIVLQKNYLKKSQKNTKKTQKTQKNTKKHKKIKKHLK
jgi:hypothetical protein